MWLLYDICSEYMTARVLLVVENMSIRQKNITVRRKKMWILEVKSEGYMNNMSVRVVLAENKYECSTKNEC